MRIHLAQQSDEERNLFLHRRVIHHLSNAIGRDFLRFDAHERRIVHVLIGEFEYALRQRCRKQHRLTTIGRRQTTQHVADVGDEAEIEHAIGFVEHDGLRFA